MDDIESSVLVHPILDGAEVHTTASRRGNRNKCDAQLNLAALKQDRNLGSSVSDGAIGGCSKRTARTRSEAVSVTARKCHDEATKDLLGKQLDFDGNFERDRDC